MSDGPKEGMWPSPFNQPFGPAIAAARRILISDCTLRDGEQQAGVVFDRAAKVSVARALDSLGIYEIEAGTVASSEEDRLAITTALSAPIDVTNIRAAGDADGSQSAWTRSMCTSCVSYTIGWIRRRCRPRCCGDG